MDDHNLDLHGLKLGNGQKFISLLREAPLTETQALENSNEHFDRECRDGLQKITEYIYSGYP